jgi:hypothetical protein
MGRQQSVVGLPNGGHEFVEAAAHVDPAASVESRIREAGRADSARLIWKQPRRYR